ncbi:hypothetical protein [Streptomyces sp. NPDC049906]|uniref:hypothetical protein n=1 Tax=Streptomyces sp. NPDC049906 TaxID=3155656 RepID=UPI0034468AC8
MSSSSTGVLARVPELVRGAPRGHGGALWRLAARARQLDANVIRLRPGATVAAHVEPDLDVLVYVTGGGGWLVVDGVRQEALPGAVVWLPRGTAREIGADGDGLTYLTVHRRRPGLTIRRGPVATGAGAQEAPEPCGECGQPTREPGARFCARCGTALR